ncbi:MAG: hypothetical protein CMP20_15770 [Rickettsiales bacterium]|nr:hypothetical protein [Rickettsiales bacterium]
MRTRFDADEQTKLLIEQCENLLSQTDLTEQDIETTEHNLAVLTGKKDGQLKSLYPNSILPSWMFGKDSVEVPLQRGLPLTTSKIEVVEFSTTKP